MCYVVKSMWTPITVFDYFTYIQSSIHPYNLCRQTFSGWDLTFLFQHECLCTQRSPERGDLLDLVCRSELNQTFLGLIGTPTVSQASSSNICAWPQWHFCVWKRANPSKAFPEVQLLERTVNAHNFDEMFTVQQAHVSCLGVHIIFAMCIENLNASFFLLWRWLRETGMPMTLCWRTWSHPSLHASSASCPSSITPWTFVCVWNCTAVSG